MALFGNKTKSPSDPAAADKEKKPRGTSLRKKGKSAPEAAPPATDNTLDFSDFTEEALTGAMPGVATNGASAPVDVSTPATNGKAARAKSSKKGVKSGTMVGLNIGNDSIKVIEVRSKAGEFAITGMASVPTPSESMSNGVVMSVSTLARAVQDAFKQAGIKSRRVVSSVAGTGALVVRIIEVPKMSDSELSDNMASDADRYIPFPVSEVIMDYKALRELPSDPDSPNMEVLLAAAQREIIDLHVRVVQEAKLDPQAIDVEPLAAARSFPQNSNGAGGDADFADYNDVTALLNIGATGTEISILRGDILVFTRSVPTGGYALTQGIVDYLGMPWEDAERLKCEMGDALPPHAIAAAPGAYAAPDPYAAPAPYAAPTGGTQPAAEGADDWSEFGLFDEEPSGAPAATDPFADTSTILDTDFGAPTTTTGAAPAPSSGAGSAQTGDASADPFDLDFFNQGPRNDEPTERHAQQENGPDNPGADQPAGFDSSSFSVDDEPKSVTSEQPSGTEAPDSSVLPSFMPQAVEDEDVATLPTTTDPESVSGGDQPLAYGSVTGFNEPDAGAPTGTMPSVAADADDDMAVLPSVTSGGSSATTAAPVASAFDFPLGDLDPGQSTLPSRDIAGQAAGAAGAGAVGAGAMGASAASAAAAPVFQFGDAIDEPAAVTGIQAPATPAPGLSLEKNVEASPATPATAGGAPGGLGFNFDALDTPVEAPAPVVGAPVPSESSAGDDLDLDSLIGSIAAPPAGGESTVGVAPVAGTEFPDLQDVSGSADFASGDFGPGAFAPGAGVDDNFDVDLESFGMGLAPTDAAHDLGVDAETLYSILHPILESLANEVRRSLEYHASRYPDAAVRHITIVGGGAKLKNIDAYFTETLGIPTIVGNPLTRMSLQAPKLEPEYVESDGPAFATALGLAMRDLV